MTPPPDDDQDPDACQQCLNLIGPRSHWKGDRFVVYTCIMARTIQGRVQDAVLAERVRQDGLWGPVERLTHSPDKWNSLVMEEVGEAAKALNEDDPAQMMIELVQAAATIYSWIESIEHRSQVVLDLDNARQVLDRKASEAIARFEEAHPDGLPDQPWER